VDRNEIGSIFAIVAVIQAVSNCLSHLYQMIFANTLNWHSGFVYCLNSMFFMAVAAIAIYLLHFYVKNKIKPERIEQVNLWFSSQWQQAL
jgi:Mg2+ and Co2+ transporter CorA